MRKYDDDQMIANFRKAMIRTTDLACKVIRERMRELDKHGGEPSYIDNIKVQVDAWAAGGSREMLADCWARLYCDQTFESEEEPEKEAPSDTAGWC
jgi:hypothetical protein